MPIDRYKRREFEDTLALTEYEQAPPQWAQGEWVYTLMLGAFARIVVRSTLDHEGVAKDTGDDSIRMWLEVQDSERVWQVMRGAESHTNRVPGWDRRMLEKIEYLAMTGDKIKRAVPMHCGRRCWVNIVQKEGKNQGRPFAKCAACKEFICFLDEPEATRAEMPASAALERRSSPDMPQGVTVSSVTVEDDFLTSLANVTKLEVVQVRALSEQQRTAVYADTERPVVLRATAGAGKTFSIVHRYEYLLTQGFKPEQIAVIAFNKAMGDQLGFKIVKQCPTAHSGLGYICTIHALCFRLHKQITGKTFDVAEGYVEKKLAKQVVEDVWGGDEELPTWTELLQVINGAKGEGLSEGEDLMYYLKTVPDHAAKLVKARAKFDALMRAEGKISFTDMLFNVDYLLRVDKEYRQRAQSLFRYVIVDEGQDVSRQAMRIVRTLVEKHNRLFIVGDQDQLLYRWLRASPEYNIGEGVRDAFGDQLVELKLETNYRSGTEIVAVGQRLIAYNYSALGGPYPQEFMKACRARDDAPVGSSKLLGAFDTPADEAMAVVEKIVGEIARGERVPGDYMATSRTRAYLAYIEAALMRHQVPFVNVSGGSFWLQKHIQDVMNYLRLVYDPNNKDAFDRVKNIASNDMTMPWRGSAQYGQYCSTRFLGDEFMRACNGKMSNMWAATQQKSTWKPGVEDLQDLFDKLSEYKVDLVLTIKRVLAFCYLKYLRVEEGLQSDENSAKEEDFEVMIDVAEKLSDWRKFFAFVDQSVENAKRTKDKDHSALMKIGTVYAFKGDERKVVYNLGWGEGEMQTPQGKVPAGMLPHTFDLTPTPSSGVFNLTSQGRIDDARCVAFVAATRAIDEAWFSYAVMYRNCVFGPSRFLIEAGLTADPAIEGEAHNGDGRRYLADNINQLSDDVQDYLDVD